MEKEFWIERWNNNQIGFHRNDFNPHLTEHFKSLHTNTGTVFVPFCGKSLDMVWLENNGYSVIANEVSELAVKAFFTENSLPYDVLREGEFNIYLSGRIKIFAGDFFNLKKEYLESADCVYDRASLIALPADMRKKYAEHMSRILREDVSMLLVTMEYGDGEMNGPPFSVKEEEVNSLFSGDFLVSKIKDEDALNENPDFKKRGLSKMREKVYKLIRGQ